MVYNINNVIAMTKTQLYLVVNTKFDVHDDLCSPYVLGGVIGNLGGAFGGVFGGTIGKTVVFFSIFIFIVYRMFI